MTRKRTPKEKRTSAKPLPAEPPAPLESTASEIGFSNLSLHELFEQQAADMLERADIDEEQKQSILLALGCPCCGTGGPSFSFRLKRRT